MFKMVSIDVYGSRNVMAMDKNGSRCAGTYPEDRRIVEQICLMC